jgi:hypothetical protein
MGLEGLETLPLSKCFCTYMYTYVSFHRIHDHIQAGDLKNLVSGHLHLLCENSNTTPAASRGSNTALLM